MERDAPPAPTVEEWSRIERICALLQPFDEITTQFSRRYYPTTNMYLINVWRIQSSLDLYSNASQCIDDLLRETTKKMKVKFDKYWESYSLILSFAAVLDPHFKLKNVEFCFTVLDPETEELKTKHVKDQLFKLFAEYEIVPSSSNVMPTNVKQTPSDLAAFASYNNVRSYHKSQLKMYLAELPLDPKSELDVLQWWKDSAKRFPYVANMARDILSIPITTVASESAFSLGGRILMKWRASLKTENAEAFITTCS